MKKIGFIRHAGVSSIGLALSERLNHSFCVNFHAQLARVCYKKLTSSSASKTKKAVLLCLILLCSEVNISLNAPVARSIRITTPYVYALIAPVKQPGLRLTKAFAPILGTCICILTRPDYVPRLIDSISLIAKAIAYPYLYTNVKGAFWFQRHILLPHDLAQLSLHVSRGPPHDSPIAFYFFHSCVSPNPQNRIFSYAPFNKPTLIIYKNIFVALIITQKYYGLFFKRCLEKAKGGDEKALEVKLVRVQGQDA